MSLDPKTPRRVRAWTVVDEGTYQQLRERAKTDTDLGGFARVLGYCLSLGIDAYLTSEPTTDCTTCDNGRQMPEADSDRRITTEGHSVVVVCANCGRCLQA